MPAIVPTSYSRMIQAWPNEPLPLEKRANDTTTTTQGNGQEAVNILLGVILGVAGFFVLVLMYVTLGFIQA